MENYKRKKTSSINNSPTLLLFAFAFFCFVQKVQAIPPSKVQVANTKEQHSSYQDNRIIVVPSISARAIVNPGKGWVIYGSVKNQPSEVLDIATVGYVRYSWSKLEPEEGLYQWEVIDNDIKAWKEAGKKFAFGVMCASTHSSNFWVSPKWVFDAGAKYDSFELKDPKLNTTGTPGSKLVPVFDDPVFIKKMENFIKALAARYDGNPNIAFIDIRSYGNWGEGHMYPFGKPDISIEKYKEHIQIHRDAFHKTLLQLPTGPNYNGSIYDWAVSIGVGLRRDGICGNSDGGELTRCNGKMASVFEFFGNYEMMEKLGWWYGKKDDQNRGFTLESCIEKGKPTYCDLSRGGESGLNLLKKEPDLIRKLTNRLGYHFVLSKAVLPSVLSKNKENRISVTWENKGVAPIYIPAKVAYALISSDGQIVKSCEATASTPEGWESDHAVTNEDKLNFRDVKTGKYILAVGILQPNDGKRPSIKIGVELKNTSGWYELGMITLK